MRFEPADVQADLLNALDKLLEQTPPAPMDGVRTGFDAELDAVLAASGLLDAAGMEAFGPLAGALVVMRVCRLPAVVEVAASALLRPLLCPDLPRPLAVVAGPPGRPVRFLAQARSVLFLRADDARVATLPDGAAEACPDFYAFPMARLNDPGAVLATAAPVDAVAAERLHRVALACELAGSLAGALDAVLEHVRTRRQFNRPIGSFQAVQHRLAAGASRIGAGRMLALRAADAVHAEDPALALGYLQDCAPGIVYDLHQFMGAMGLTLEHPLYRWTYRAKLLLAEGGGASRQLADAALAVWGAA